MSSSRVPSWSSMLVFRGNICQLPATALPRSFPEEKMKTLSATLIFEMPPCYTCKNKTKKNMTSIMMHALFLAFDKITGIGVLWLVRFNLPKWSTTVSWLLRNTYRCTCATVWQALQPSIPRFDPARHTCRGGWKMVKKLLKKCWKYAGNWWKIGKTMLRLVDFFLLQKWMQQNTPSLFTPWDAGCRNDFFLLSGGS